VIGLLVGGASTKGRRPRTELEHQTVERHLVNIDTNLGVRGRTVATS
jgi:hypothetical protein